MKKYLFIVSVFIAFTSFSGSVLAQTTTTGAEDSRHNELRAVLVDLQTAVNNKDIEKLKSHLDPNVNVVYQNAEVADGIAAVDAFYQRMLKGDSPVLKSYSAEIKADQLSEFYGNTAVSYGTIVDSLSFTGGSDIKMTSRWTATLVRHDDGQWKIVSVQLGANVFDNPLLSAAKASVTYFAIGGALLGLIIGFFIGKIYRKRE